MDLWERFDKILNVYWQKLIVYTPRILLALVIVSAGYLIASWITGIVRDRLAVKADDKIAAIFLSKVAKLVMIIGVTLLALEVVGLGKVSTGLITAFGASTLIVGFAFKDIGENFLAGTILAFSRPFKMGDTIEINGYFGKVKYLAFRYTQLKTFDGKDVYVPNSKVLNNSVTNFTEDGYIRQDFMIGIAYEDDIDEAIKVVESVVASFTEIVDDGFHDSFACVDELGPSTVNIKVRFWLRTKEFRRKALETRGTFIRLVKEALNENGIGMPADIKELKIYGSEDSIPIRIKNQETDKLEAALAAKEDNKPGLPSGQA